MMIKRCIQYYFLHLFYCKSMISAFSLLTTPGGRHHCGSSSSPFTCLHANSNNQADEKKLLQELDSSFSYEGRLKSSGSSNSSSSREYRCGFVSIIGAPNMGKSTLLNALLQEDLCIATARPQTTRHAILGLLTTDDCQVCLVDTPGVIDTPAYKLQEGMMEAVVGALYDADALLVVTDLFSTPIPNDELFAKVQRSRKPIIVVVNKIDLADKVNRRISPEHTDQTKTVTVEQAVALWRQLVPQALAILPTAASQGPDDPGVVALRRLLAGGPDLPAALRALGRPVPGMFANNNDDDDDSAAAAVVVTMTDQQARESILPISPPLYDEEALTDRTERFIASEMIRASLFECLKKELPYCCEVQVTEFKEPEETAKKPVIRIAATVIVERDSQKLIVVGKNGEKIKQVGTLAREKIEEFLQHKVFLNLNVKVNKDWRKNEDKLKEYGYLQ